MQGEAKASDDNPPSLRTSGTLLLCLRPGSPSRELAWEQFHHRYAPIIAGFARKLGVRAAECDDLVQDVLVGFFRQSERFEYDPSKGRFRSFLKVCTFRTLCNSRARDMKFRGVPLEKVDPQSPEVEQTWEQIWQDEQLRRAVEEVRKRYSVNAERRRTFMAFEQYVLRERPQSEVAAEFGISIASVHQAKHRLTAAIKRQVELIEDAEG